MPGEAEAAAGSSRQAPQGRDDRPNVVLIMADDLGAECLGCYGSSTYETPNLDRLAREGMQFTDAYCTPLCTPTRAQLMTGQYPFRNGWPMLIGTRPRDEQVFEPELPQIGRIMSEAGYATAVAGKWQMARFDEHPNHAAECGFDEHCLWTWQVPDTPDWVRKEGEGKPSRFWDPGIWQNGELRAHTEGRFGPDIFTEFLLEFAERNREDPFFAYFPMALTHWPFVPTPGTPGDPDGTRANPRAQENFELMVAYMDELVGRIVDRLSELGIREETLLLFTGDNGTAQEIVSQVRGQNVPGQKLHLTTAGTRVPLIANWPGTVPSGRVNRNPVDFTDFVPTLADFAETELPEAHTFDGRSIRAQLEGGDGDPRDWVFCQFEAPGHAEDVEGNVWFIQSRWENGRAWRLRYDGTLQRLDDYYDAVEVDPGSSTEASAWRDRLARWAEELLADADDLAAPVD